MSTKSPLQAKDSTFSGKDTDKKYRSECIKSRHLKRKFHFPSRGHSLLSRSLPCKKRYPSHIPPPNEPTGSALRPPIIAMRFFTPLGPPLQRNQFGGWLMVSTSDVVEAFFQGKAEAVRTFSEARQADRGS